MGKHTLVDTDVTTELSRSKPLRDQQGRQCLSSRVIGELEFSDGVGARCEQGRSKVGSRLIDVRRSKFAISGDALETPFTQQTINGCSALLSAENHAWFLSTGSARVGFL